MLHVKAESQKAESPWKDQFQNYSNDEPPAANDFLGFNEGIKEDSEDGGADPFALAMVAADDGDHNMADE